MISIEANLPEGRASAGTLTVKDDFGDVVAKYGGVGGRNQLNTKSDTPTGTYGIGEVVDTTGWNQNSYGPVGIRINPLAGNAANSQRSGFLIHGGRKADTNSEWDINYILPILSS